MDYLKIKKQFFQNGWSKLPSFLRKDEVKRIKAEINLILKKKSKNIKKGDIHFTKNKVNTIHTLDTISKFFFKLKNKKKFNSVANKILNEKTKPQWVQLFAKPARYGLPAPPHQDNYYWNVKDCKTVTMWIALDHVNNNNGALYYYTKSHLKGRLEHEPSFAKGTSQTVKKNILNKFSKKDKLLIDASPGDMLIHHGYTVHGSSRNASNKSRKGISIWFKASKAKIDKKNLNKYNLSLQKQHQAFYQKKSK